MMLGSPCSPCCGCPCPLPPASAILRWGYLGALNYGFPINSANINNVLYQLLFNSNNPPSPEAVMSRDDSIAPYGGFGYSFSGAPTVGGSPLQVTGTVSGSSVSATCYSLTTRLFFFSASRASFSDPFDSTSPGFRPCLRWGLYFSDAWRWDQNTTFIFSRVAQHDGLAVGTTVTENNMLALPFICVPSSLTANFSELPNSTYDDSTSSTTLTAPNGVSIAAELS